MSSQNIYPKNCGYGCNTRIYCNTVVNEYWEVLSQKKHVCPNRTSNVIATSNTTKSTFYSKKSDS